ncbi:MAG: U32 family peptidase C-terminal domain-containing protein [Leptospiraceae bacterium]|nr:U32 family peptidase C-terminal domain-containing protein [Leptospiraceae bacterium]MCK6380072.1 U32 family peptidase C-terminal domain-containing protein [Leptospiraceae bacterium]NUM42179.1 U32 family peptidase C-terminal domain-containing protein [Leptospiraceae bacterium]
MYPIAQAGLLKEKVAEEEKSKRIKIPELLLPAGSPEKMKTAFLFGADAVYCGVPRYSLRARENEFRLESLKEAVAFTRSLGKKIYFTINAIPRNSKLPNFPKYLDEMAAMSPDAFIMADPGLILVARERTPEIDIHISVQTNTMNYAAVKFWEKIGAKRVILSREVSIREAGEIKNEVPSMELEVFVHGSICIAHSGRCFMSNYFAKRDANQGACNNACRDKYQVVVKNLRQNDEFMEIEEDENGTYLMNSKDLRAIEFLKEISEAGIDSIKVEGRTKNDYYVAIVAKSYRNALDDIKEEKSFDRGLLKELEKVASRKYFSGFLTYGMEDRVTSEEMDFQNHEEGVSGNQNQVYLGRVIFFDKKGQSIQIEIKNKVQIGDTVEVFFPSERNTKTFQVSEIYHKNVLKDVLSGGMGEIRLKVPFEIPENSFLSILKNSNIEK